MYREIAKELKTYADDNFAEWIKPYLSIKNSSDDVVLGIRVPILRKLAKKYKIIDNNVLEKLLTSTIHEERELALFIMVLKTKTEPKDMYEMYLRNLKYINNWDLIDYTAPHIVAPNTSVECLRELMNSDYIWANRVAVVSTIFHIKHGNFELALEFAKKCMYHSHHLMHKVSGWMLREIGKKDEKVLIEFLEKYSDKMPSIMRSYATEKLKKNNNCHK